MRRVCPLLLMLAASALTAAAQLTITTRSLIDAVVGQPYPAVTLTTVGAAGAVNWSVSSGSLPPGFVVGPGPIGQPASGTFCLGMLVVGAPPSCPANQPVPSIANSYTFTIQAMDQQEQLAQKTFTFVVASSPVKITSQSLPNAGSTLPYSFSLTAAGGAVEFGDGQYLWSLAFGSLPQGFTLDQNTGIISSPAAGAIGSSTFTILVSDTGTGTSDAKQFTLLILAPLLIVQTTLPPASQGDFYQTTLTASGGLPPYTWAFAGTNTQGLSINPNTGVITGNPPLVGTFQLSAVTLQDSGGTSTQRIFTLQVVTLPVAVVTTSLPPGRVGLAYDQVLVASGGTPPYRWTVVAGSGALPQGLNLDAVTGRIQGTPTAPGPQTFTVRVTDSLAASASQVLTLNVTSNILTVTSGTAFIGNVGTAFSQQLTAVGGQFPLSWTVISGTPPSGLALSSLGVIAGTPTSVGPFSFTVQVTDPFGLTGTAAITITVFQTLSIVTQTLPDAGLGNSYSQTLAATGGLAPYSWAIISGNLPAGINFNQGTGVISGSSNVLGPQTFTVQATDANLVTAQKVLTLRVSPLLIITSSGSFTGTAGTAFSQTLTVVGGFLPYTWSVSSGALPGGLQLDGNTGAITGTPNTSGTINLDFRVNDSRGQTAVQHATFTVGLPALPTTSIGLGNTTQPAVSVGLSGAFPVNINGTMTLSFVSLVGGTDTVIGFSNGSPTLNFVISAGATQATFPAAPNAAVIPGTLAGTITLQVTALTAADGTNLLPGTPLTKTIVTNSAVPVITSVTLQQVTGGINVIVTGYSNTREVTSGLFHFTVSSGNTLSQSDITVQLGSAYTTWFSSPTANGLGGRFQLTMPFSVTQGSGTAVTGVQATLTNTQGPSPAVSSQ